MIVKKQDTSATVDPLDALATEAAAADLPAAQGQGAAPAAPEGPPPMTNAQALAAALGLGRDGFCKWTGLESPQRVLTDEKVQEVAALWDPVLTKYGVNVGDYLGPYALEITAVIGTAVIAFELRQAVRAEIAAKQPAKQKDAPELPAAATGDHGG